MHKASTSSLLSTLSMELLAQEPGVATRTVEMYIMDEPVQSSGQQNGSEPAPPSDQPRTLQRRKSMTVAPPRAKPLLQGSLQQTASPAWQQTQNSQTKKLRVELSMAQSELHSRGTEMKEANSTIR